jgi:hypothetical protein
MITKAFVLGLISMLGGILLCAIERQYAIAWVLGATTILFIIAFTTNKQG